MTIKHDKDGFLVGDMIDTQREILATDRETLKLTRGIATSVNAIARNLGLAARAAATRSNARVVDAGRAASAPRAPTIRARDAAGRFVPVAEPVRQPQASPARADGAQPARSELPASGPTAPGARDQRGRFRGKGGAGDPADEETTGRLTGLLRRLGAAAEGIKGVAQGTSQIDPAVAAASEVKEVVEPLGRGAMALFGRSEKQKDERKRERWYKRFLAALTGKKGEPAGGGGGMVGGDVRSGSMMGTMFGSIIGRIGMSAMALLPLLGKLVLRVLGPVAAVWASWNVGQWVGNKIYEWLDESGILTKVFDAFDTISETITSTWDRAVDGFVKALEFFKSIPERVGLVLDALDQGIRSIPVVGDLYGKATEALKDVRNGYNAARNPVVVDTPAGPMVQQPSGMPSANENIGRAVGTAVNGMAAARDWALGRTSERFESGGRGAGTISTGNGDAGGASYGTYQLSSRAGTLRTFLDSTGYAEKFKGMAPGTPEFNAQWQKLAREDSTFATKQHDFIKATHYEPQVAMLKKNGIDLSGRGAAVQDAVWSTSTQFGPKSELITKALAGKNVAAMSDADVVNAIQNYKIANNDTLFKSSSAGVRAGTLQRAQAERKALLGLTGAAPTQTAGVDRIAPAQVPGTVPEKLPPVPEVAIPPAPPAEKGDKTTTAIVREPIGQDVGDRAIAHIVTGGIGA